MDLAELAREQLDVYEGKDGGYWHPEHGVLELPDGWDFLASGDAFITRTVKPKARTGRCGGRETATARTAGSSACWRRRRRSPRRARPRIRRQRSAPPSAPPVPDRASAPRTLPGRVR